MLGRLNPSKVITLKFKIGSFMFKLLIPEKFYGMGGLI